MVETNPTIKRVLFQEKIVQDKIVVVLFVEKGINIWDQPQPGFERSVQAWLDLGWSI